MSQVSSEKSFFATAADQLDDLRPLIGFDDLLRINGRLVSAFLEANLRILEGCQEAVKIALEAVDNAASRASGGADEG